MTQSPRHGTCRPRRLVLTLAALLAFVPAAFAQIGGDPEALAGLADLDTEALDDGVFRTAAGMVVEPVVRNGALYALRGQSETFEASAARELAALVGAATGFGAGIEQPVLDFLDEAVPQLAGSGPSVVGIERFRLTLDVTGAVEPFDLTFALALAEVRAEAFPVARHAKGPADAAIVVREFSDFQCPACRRFNTELMPQLQTSVLAREDVRIEYHHFPLGTFPNSFRAAEAAECVADADPGDPEAFWTYKDALYERQPQWSSASDPDALFVAIAEDAGVVSDGVADCLAEGRHEPTVEAARVAAVALQLRGTPSVFVGGFQLDNFADPAAYAQAIAYLETFGADEATAGAAE